jgi:hypothetical protein
MDAKASCVTLSTAWTFGTVQAKSACAQIFNLLGGAKLFRLGQCHARAIGRQASG